MESMTHPQILEAERTGYPVSQRHRQSHSADLDQCHCCQEYCRCKSGICADCRNEIDDTLSILCSEIDRLHLRQQIDKREFQKELAAVIDACKQAGRALL